MDPCSFSYFRGAWRMAKLRWINEDIFYISLLPHASFFSFASYLRNSVLFFQLLRFLFKFLQKSHHKQSVKLLKVCIQNKNFVNLFCFFFLCFIQNNNMSAQMCSRIFLLLSFGYSFPSRVVLLSNQHSNDFCESHRKASFPLHIHNGFE